MTASSVELFPCRVQLMGLPRSTTSVSSAASEPANLRNPGIGLIRRPPIQKVQRVSRNLFGAPDPIEMKKLYEQETERQRKYVLRRYNFDTKSSTDANEYNRNENSTDEHDNIKNMNSFFKQPTTFPTLIEQELKQHDQRRQGEKQTLCRTTSEETPPPNTKVCNHANIIPKVSRRCEYTTLSPAIDRQKPYIRQSLLTERFNIRKSKVRLSRNTKCYRVGVIATNSLKAKTNLEVIPQHLEDNACNIKNEEDKKSICNTTCVCTLVDNHKDNKSTVVCGDKHTAVSLQLVVSTQNLS